MSLPFSSSRILRRATSVVAMVVVVLFMAAGTAVAKGPPQFANSGTSAGNGSVVYGAAGCFVQLSEDGSFARTFGTGNLTFVFRSPYEMTLCVQPSDAGGFTDTGSFVLSTPSGTLNASVSGTETVTAFSFTMTATSGTGLYQGAAGTIAWNGTRTVTGASTYTASGVWTANLNRPVL
jgi:hypothetical protein